MNQSQEHKSQYLSAKDVILTQIWMLKQILEHSEDTRISTQGICGRFLFFPVCEQLFFSVVKLTFMSLHIKTKWLHYHRYLLFSTKSDLFLFIFNFTVHQGKGMSPKHASSCSPSDTSKNTWSCRAQVLWTEGL